MKNAKLVKELEKNLKSNKTVTLILNMTKYSVTEVCEHSGYWGDEEYTVSFQSTNNWKRSQINAKIYGGLEYFIDLLKEKELNEMLPSDFEDMELGDSQDGSVEIGEIEWDEDNKPSDEEIEEIDKMDLYNIEISDSELQFEAGSIFLLEAIIHDKHKLSLKDDGTYTIEYGPMIKKFTKTDKKNFETRLIAAQKELVELKKLYELLLDEEIDENIPELEYCIDTPVYGNDKVKVIIDDARDWRKKDVVELEFITELGNNFKFQISKLTDLIKLRNQLTQAVDKFDRPMMDGFDIDDVWENKIDDEQLNDVDDIFADYVNTIEEDQSSEDNYDEDNSEDEVVEEKPKAKKAVAKKKK